MSDFADICITAWKEDEEDRANERRRLVKDAFYTTFVDMRFLVAEDARSVTIQGLVLQADIDNGEVDFRMERTCPKCHSQHTYLVAGRSDIGRVLSMTGCSDCQRKGI